jgi:hypothetical protein
MVWCESRHVCNGRCVRDQPTPFIDEPASDPVLLRTLAAAGLPATDLSARSRGTPAAPRESCLGENRSLGSVEVDTLMFLVDRSEEHRDHPITIVRRAGYRSGAAEDPGGR